MKVNINQELCTGCGLCSDNCPDIFELGDETAKVKVEEVPENSVDCCRQAAEDCPTEAIRIIE